MRVHDEFDDYGDEYMGMCFNYCPLTSIDESSDEELDDPNNYKGIFHNVEEEK